MPVSLEIVDWTLPDPKDFHSYLGIVQSPDSIAMYYKLKMWSDKHWEMIATSLKYLGQAGMSEIYLPLVCKTHFGNEHSMVRWIRKPDGGWSHDFNIVEKYLDLAVKHLGKVPTVVLYCWEQAPGAGHNPSHLSLAEKSRDGVLFHTVLNPNTGMLTVAEVPKWNTPESRAFWEPVIQGIRTRLADRGIEKSMTVGIAGDFLPSSSAVSVLKSIAPDAGWIRHSHSTQGGVIHGQKIACVAHVFGSGRMKHPSSRVIHLPRNTLRRYTPLGLYYRCLENSINSSRRSKKTDYAYGGGVARLGADFWPILKDRRGRKRNLAGRFPETKWGQLNLSFMAPDLLAPGREGAVPTVRFMMLLENAQECEARILIQQALAEPEKKAKLGKKLATRAQGLITVRNWCGTMISREMRAHGPYRIRKSAYDTWFRGSGRKARTRALYALAAEVAVD
jgi:hypothetical protein